MTWSDATEAAWQAFARRGPWITRPPGTPEYPLLRAFVVEAHLHNDAVSGRAVIQRLVDDGLCNPHANDHADRIGELCEFGRGLLNGYDEVLSEL